MKTMNENSLFESDVAAQLPAALEKLELSLARYKEVSSQDDLAKATEILAQAKGFKKTLDDERSALIKDAVARQREINAEAKTLSTRFDAIITHFDRVSRNYMLQEERRREEEHAAEQRRIAAEAEVARAAAQAERDEKLSKLHADLKKAKAVMSRVKASDAEGVMRAASKVAELVSKIQELGGQVAPEPAAFVPPPEKAAPVVGALGSRTHLQDHWTYEVVDLGEVPRAYLVIDPSKVAAAIRAGQRDIPGLRIFNDKRLVSRR